MNYHFELPKIGHYIDGVFTNSCNNDTFDNFSSATGELLAAIPNGQSDDINKAVEAAKTAYATTWRHTSLAQRCQYLEKIADAILARREHLAAIESIDTGKPISETLNGDIPRSAKNFSFFAKAALSQNLPSYQSEDGSWHYTRRQPLGVVGLITPWNLPLYLLTWKLAPALASGNTVVIKPAELTPLSAMALGEILDSVGLPKGVVNIVQGFGAGAAGEALVSHPHVRAISFTGETTTGSAIMSAAAKTLKKLSFELGGKGAAVVYADADVDKLVPTVTHSAFRNQGQICLAGSRLIVHESIAEQVTDGILKKIKDIKIGHPLDSETTMGALISTEHRDKVAAYGEIAKSEATVLTGAKIPNREGAYYEPTLVTGVQQDSRLIQEEIFGPLLTVQTFREHEEAMSYLNGTDYGLSCSIWSSKESTLERAGADADMGLVWYNSWFLRHLATPFGGMKKSGVGREGGHYSLDFFSDYKTISKPNFG